jgi:hypothetical protein
MPVIESHATSGDASAVERKLRDLCDGLKAAIQYAIAAFLGGSRSSRWSLLQ